MASHIPLAAAPVAQGLVSTTHEYDHLARVYLPFAAVIFGIIVLVMGGAALWFRRRPAERAGRWHEHHLAESVYAVVLAAIVAFLLFETFRSEHRVDTVANEEKGGVTVDVVASRWEWTFYYPKYHFSVYSGTSGIGTFVIPVNEPVHFYLSSVDVIHAFWVPGIYYKHDNFPGQTMLATLTFPKSGTFAGQCAEYCGLNHSEMVFNAKAVSPAAFASWAASRGRSPA